MVNAKSKIFPLALLMLSAVGTNQAEKRADATASESEIVKELTERIKKLEASQKVDKDEKQKRLLLNLDILTRAEQRTESLRKQMFEMIEKENAIKARLDQLDIDMRPDVIERALQLNGSMRPEEVRESRRKTLNAEKANLQSLLTEIQNTRSNLSLNLQKAEAVVEKLRAKLEKDIDDSLVEDTDK
jgi:Nnf1